MVWRAAATIGTVLCAGGWILTDTAAPGDDARHAESPSSSAIESAALPQPYARLVGEATPRDRRPHPAAPPLDRRSPFEFGADPPSPPKRSTPQVAPLEPPTVPAAPNADPVFVLLGVATDTVGGRRVRTAIIGTAEDLWLAQEGQRHTAEGHAYRMDRIGEDWAEIANSSTGRVQRLHLR